MTTAELGLITTAAVGIAAVAGPTLTAWLNRAHERAMLRSTRTYEQRRQTYIDLSIFLERQRALLADVGNGLATTTTFDEIQQRSALGDRRSELGELLGRLAVDGTPEVQAKVEDYGRVRNVMLVSLMRWLDLHRASTTSSAAMQPPGLPEAWQGLLQSTPPAVEALEAVQRAMRDELTEL